MAAKFAKKVNLSLDRSMMGHGERSSALASTLREYRVIFSESLKLPIFELS